MTGEGNSRNDAFALKATGGKILQFASEGRETQIFRASLWCQWIVVWQRRL